MKVGLEQCMDGETINIETRPLEGEELESILPYLAGLPDAPETPCTVLIIPDRVEGDTGFYRESSGDLAKYLRAAGYDVNFAHPSARRKYIVHKSADWLAPALLVAQEVVVSGMGQLLADTLRDMLAASSPRTMSITLFEFNRGKTSVRLKRIRGPAKEVIKSLEKLEHRK